MLRRIMIAFVLALPLWAVLAWPAPAAAQGQTLYLPLIVQGYRPTGPSSFNLIDAAVARGEIDAETGLVYGVFALFDDPRLPAPYRGIDADVRESDVQDRVHETWSTLKPETRALLLPFIIPPIYKGSWFDLRYGAAASAGPNVVAATPTPDPRICQTMGAGWSSVITADKKVRVWWNDQWAADKSQADLLAISIEARIWAGLLEIHGAGHQPLSDEGRKCGGPDGALDIFITPIKADGYWMPYEEDLGPTAGCPMRAGQLQINRGLSGNGLLAAAIHEMMHAFNASYAHAHPCSEFKWLNEATAEWAVDHVDPANQDEHNYALLYLDHPSEPLESLRQVAEDGETKTTMRAYGAYLFPFYLSRFAGGPRQIGQIWEASLLKDSLDATNTIITGGFKETWPEFALKTWNVMPVDDYRKVDQMYFGPKPFYTAAESNITMAPGPTWQKTVPVTDVRHLSHRYFHFKFNDPNIRSVGWYNGVTANLHKAGYIPGPGLPDHGQTYFASTVSEAQKKGARVWAIYRLDGDVTWQPPEDWTDRAFSGFCRDVTAERITDLVLIYSNSEWQDRTYQLEAPGEEPQLLMSNIGCWRWEGRSTYTITEAQTLNTTVEVDVAWERHSFGPQFPLPTYFKLASAAGKWTVSGTWGACVASGSGPFHVDPADEPQMTVFDRILSGPAYRGYGGRGQTNQEITYTLTCPPPMGVQQVTKTIGVWWEPPVGLNPELTFKPVEADGVTINDTETHEEAFGTFKFTETRTLKAVAQP